MALPIEPQFLPFDVAATMLTKGEFIDSASEVSLVSIGDNKILTFIDRAFKPHYALVSYNPRTNQIDRPTTDVIQPRPEEPETRIPVYLRSLTGIELDRLKLAFGLHINDSIVECSKIQWQMATTFEDLQSLNLMFIQGLIPETPYHGGPLDLESSPIKDHLYLLNLYGVITYNSQPHDKFTYKGKLFEQRPFVTFFYDNVKADSLVQMMAAKIPGLIIRVQNNRTMQVTNYGPDNLTLQNGQFALAREFVNGIWVDEYNTSLPVSLGFQAEDSKTFGPSLRPMVTERLSEVWLHASDFTDALLPELLQAAKSLL